MLGGHEQIELAGLFPETQTMMAELPGLWIHAWAMTGDSQVLHDYMKLDTVHIDLDTRQVQSEFPGLPDCRPPERDGTRDQADIGEGRTQAQRLPVPLGPPAPHRPVGVQSRWSEEDARTTKRVAVRYRWERRAAVAVVVEAGTDEVLT